MLVSDRISRGFGCPGVMTDEISKIPEDFDRIA
jgi:hypothetical protein